MISIELRRPPPRRQPRRPNLTAHNARITVGKVLRTMLARRIGGNILIFMTKALLSSTLRRQVLPLGDPRWGVGQTFAATTTITLLQTRVPEHMRGRVMSLNTLPIMDVPPTGRFPRGRTNLVNWCSSRGVSERRASGSVCSRVSHAAINTFSVTWCVKEQSNHLG